MYVCWASVVTVVKLAATLEVTQKLHIIFQLCNSEFHYVSYWTEKRCCWGCFSFAESSRNPFPCLCKCWQDLAPGHCCSEIWFSLLRSADVWLQFFQRPPTFLGPWPLSCNFRAGTSKPSPSHFEIPIFLGSMPF